MKIISNNNSVSFKYKSILKTLWLKGKMPSVKYGIYGGLLTKKNVTLEHLIPSSKGGKTELKNLALSKNINNWNRGDKPLTEFLNNNVFQQYCDQFKEIKLPNFNGDNYITQITETIERLIKSGQ